MGPMPLDIATTAPLKSAVSVVEEKEDEDDGKEKSNLPGYLDTSLSPVTKRHH